MTQTQNFVSPNDLLYAAQDMMLSGKTPESKQDWEIVMNFMAVNVEKSVRESACLLLRTIFDMPLSREDVTAIVAFQTKKGR